MRCLDVFNKKMKNSGGSLRNEHIFNSRMFLAETFYDDPSFQDHVYFWEPNCYDYSNKNPIPIRLYSRFYSAAVGNTVKFTTMHTDPIVVGDVLYEKKSGYYYICTEAFDWDDVNYKGKLTMCNWILKWQDSEGNIWEYPCYDINSTQYNSGEMFNKYYTIGSAQHLITLPYDENTVALHTPKRLFLDRNTLNPTAYIVTQNDTTSYNYGKKGLVKITVQQHEVDARRDRVDLGICDYMEKPDTPDAPSIGEKHSIIGYDSLTIKAGGGQKPYRGNFVDGNGNEITGLEPKWTIISDFTDKLKVDEKEGGNEVWIGVDDEGCIDESFKLVFSDVYGNYPSSVTLTIESLL